MAIGQLADYSRFVEAPPALAVLLPHEPRRDLADLLAPSGIAAIWPTVDGFKDNADGGFI